LRSPVRELPEKTMAIRTRPIKGRDARLDHPCHASVSLPSY
jgi:hypothetical protein